MKILRALPFIGVFLLTACSSGSPSFVDLGPAPEYQKPESPAEIIDHEATMPEWAGRYLEAGVAGVETLPEYQDRYVFIDRQTGSRLEPLRLWAEGFSLERDFSRLVAARIQERFIAESNGNPAEKYGRYFEAMVKGASNAVFQGALRGSGVWVKKRIFTEDGASVAEERYEYLIITFIDKETLRQQIDLLLITVRPDTPSTRDQSSASMRLRLNFYEGF
jgi:hypothetical protein